MLPISVFMITYSPYLSIVAIFIIIIYSKNKQLVFEKNKLNINLCLLFLWSVFVGMVNKNIYSVIASFVFLFYLILSVYIQNYYNKEYKIDKLLHTVVVFSIGSAAIAIIDRVTLFHRKSSFILDLFGIRQFHFDEFIFSPRVTGTFGNQNVAGTWYGIVILISIYLLMKKASKYRNLYTLSIVVCFLALISTESRGAILGLVIALIVYYLIKGNKEKSVFLGLLLSAGILLCLERPELFIRGNSFYDTLIKRMGIWEKCIYLFIKKPIMGCGLLGIYFDNNINQIHAHNLILTMATTMGIVGLGIFLNIIIKAVKDIIDLRKNNCDIAALLGAVLAFNFGQGFVDCTIYNPQAGIMFFVCLTLIQNLAVEYNIYSNSNTFNMLEYIFNLQTDRPVRYEIMRFNSVIKTNYYENKGYNKIQQAQKKVT
ncbi:O-antigen ligase family protein [Clostridium sp. DL1XJH146]